MAQRRKAYARTTTQRGYGSEHRRLRAQWKPRVEAGGVACWRCGQLIHPAEPWDLGHDDYDRRITRGHEHARCCNRAAAARKTNAIRRAKARAVPTRAVPRQVTPVRSRDW